MKKIIIALVGFPVAFLIIYFRAKIKDFTGDMDFAERYLGSGGTYTFIILLGIGTFIVTLMYVTGSLQEIVGNTVGKIF